MLRSLIDILDRAYQPRRHRDLLVALWEQERWFDTHHQRVAAEIERDTLTEAGLSGVRLATYPCDGETRYQDWIMHRAWDGPSARLVADDGTVLADRSECPASVVYWSGSLASGAAPAVGEVVDGDALATIAREAVNGKFVLTAKPPLEMKHRLLGTSPLAVVSDFLGQGRGYTEHTTRWCNTWSDGPDGWYFHAGDQAMTGFCLSPARGKWLRQRLAAEPSLKLGGFCDARLYEGLGQNVTAVLEGADPSREIWLYGHACEQGAHDNVSGVTVLVESLRLLNELIASGRLPKPRHSIRMIATEECVGMVAFATLHDDLRRRALAGMNVDGAGDAADAERPYVAHYGPLSHPSFGWAVAALIGATLQEEAGDAWHFRTRRFVPSADDMIADPHCGIPAIWLGTGGASTGYHSSADTPEVCTDDSLRCNTLLAAAWAYAMASLDGRSAAQLVGPATEWIGNCVLRDGNDDPALLSRWVAGRGLRSMARWGIHQSVYEPFAAEYASPDAEPLPGLPSGGPRYARTVWGTCTFETLPVERRKGLSRWSSWINTGLYWSNGEMPLPAVERLARAETGAAPDASLEQGFDACVEAGTMVTR